MAYKQAKYLQNNKNIRGCRSYYYTEESFLQEQNEFEEEKLGITKSKDDYAVIVHGKKLELEFEEMSELLHAMTSCDLGNECFMAAKLKAEYMTKFIPITDY